MKRLILALVLGLVSLQAFAQPAALIEAVQMPAWRERDGKRLPLVPGMELRAGDRIISGKDARVVMKLSEGSLIKLGENGSLRFTQLEPSRELFKAALQVLEGAFRFTTDIANKARKREVDVRIEQVNIGVRGTDFWGRSREERQIVCLIEGAIEVGADGEPPTTMDQPRQFYRRDKGVAQPVGLVEPQQLQQWSEETEIAAGKGALRRGGRFNLELGTSEKEAELRKMWEALRSAGYPAEMQRRQEGFAVRIRHFATREVAQIVADQLTGRYGIKDPKVTQ